MSYSTDRDFSTTIEIISTHKAKERAAKKLGIPFRYGTEIETYGVQFKDKPKHIYVDTSSISSRKNQEYHSLVKKYTKQEFNKIVNPLSKSLALLAPVVIFLLATTFGLVKCINPKKQTFQPQTIQKANHLVTQPTQKTR